MGILSWFESTAYAQWVLSGLIGYPLMLTLHALGLAIIVGVVIVISLRLLGLYASIPYTSLAGLLSVAWVGVAINVPSGSSIFMTQGTYYVTSAPFLVKITFIIFGIINLAYTQKVLRRESAGWEAAGAVEPIGRVLAASSLVLWTVALVTGRLIAYL